MHVTEENSSISKGLTKQAQFALVKTQNLCIILTLYTWPKPNLVLAPHLRRAKLDTQCRLFQKLTTCWSCCRDVTMRRPATLSAVRKAQKTASFFCTQKNTEKNSACKLTLRKRTSLRRNIYVLNIPFNHAISNTTSTNLLSPYMLRRSFCDVPAPNDFQPHMNGTNRTQHMRMQGLSPSSPASTSQHHARC